MGIRERFQKRVRVKASYKSDLRKLFKELEEQGWRIEARTKHYYAYPPDKEKPQVLISKSPSDSHAWDNMMSRLKNSGFVQGTVDVEEPEEEREVQYGDVVKEPDPDRRDYAAEQAKEQDDAMAEVLFDEVAAGAPEEDIHEIVNMINEEQIKR